jgi:inhibitor of cysteine peptidase
MKLKYFLFLSVISLFLAFAQESPKPKAIETIKTKVKKEFKIELKSNMTTGYSWKLEKNYDSTIVKSVSNEYIPMKTNLVGAGGKEIWKFKSLKKGTTILNMKYIQPWDKDEKPAQEKKYKIIIK